jgi:hypothetical protein
VIRRGCAHERLGSDLDDALAAGDEEDQPASHQTSTSHATSGTTHRKRCARCATTPGLGRSTDFSRLAAPACEMQWTVEQAQPPQVEHVGVSEI